MGARMFRSLLPFVLSFSLLTPFKFFIHSWHGATVVEKTENSIVRITMMKEEDTFFGSAILPHYCTGFAIAPHLILTANHCMGGEDLKADGQVVSVIKADDYYDLALLEDDSMKRPSLTIRNEPAQRGERLKSIGYGYGWSRLLDLDERVILENYPVEPKVPTGLILQGGFVGGMSGGPIIDKDGLVVGIVQRSGDNIGYGVGVAFIRAFLQDASPH